MRIDADKVHYLLAGIAHEGDALGGIERAAAADGHHHLAAEIAELRDGFVVDRNGLGIRADVGEYRVLDARRLAQELFYRLDGARVVESGVCHEHNPLPALCLEDGGNGAYGAGALVYLLHDAELQILFSLCHINYLTK